MYPERVQRCGQPLDGLECATAGFGTAWAPTTSSTARAIRPGRSRERLREASIRGFAGRSVRSPEGWTIALRRVVPEAAHSPRRGRELGPTTQRILRQQTADSESLLRVRGSPKLARWARLRARPERPRFYPRQRRWWTPRRAGPEAALPRCPRRCLREQTQPRRSEPRDWAGVGWSQLWDARTG